MAIDHYHAPTSLPEALERLRGGGATILAGGTDLMPQSHAGRVKLGPALVNVRRVPELGGIRIDDGTLRLGALSTMSEILHSPLVRETAAVLAVFSEGSPEVAKAGIDLSKTWTNAFVEKAKKTTGSSAK